MQPLEAGITRFLSQRLSSAPVVDGATPGKAGLLTTKCVFVYKVGKRKSSKESKLEAADARARLEVSAASRPLFLRPCVPSFSLLSVQIKQADPG